MSGPAFSTPESAQIGGAPDRGRQTAFYAFFTGRRSDLTPIFGAQT
jgi:hypothetical protein